MFRRRAGLDHIGFCHGRAPLCIFGRLLGPVLSLQRTHDFQLLNLLPLERISSVKSLFAFTAAAALVCAAGSCSALAKFSPASTPFSVSGTLDILPSTGGRSFQCPYNLTAMTTSTGGVTVSGATFCAGVTPANLPWTWKAVRVAYGHILTEWSLVIPGIACGVVQEPSTLRPTVNGLWVSGSVLTPGGCGILGNGVATPTINIVK